MSTDKLQPPVVNRYNAWGQWRPFMFRGIDELMAFKNETTAASADPDLEAALLYTRATGHEGIEFVLLSEHWDKARFQTLSNGIVLVRLWDAPEGPQPRPFLCAYDGWLPVENVSVDSLRVALRGLQDFGDFFGYQYGVPVRIFVKYRESIRMAEWRETDADDVARFRDRMSRLQDLPGQLRTSVLRCTHWHQNARRQARASDRFVSLWLALESIALVLYEHSGLIHLPLPGEDVPQTRRQRREAQDTRIEQLLLDLVAKSPTEQVSQAYFQGVVGIRRRVEVTLRTVFGSDARIDWLYSSAGPSEIRGKLVHEGWSELDAAQACDLQDYCHRLDLLILELIERILFRAWNVPIELPSKTYVGFMDPMNMIGAGTGWTVQGDFTITLGLLAHKRVLRF